MKPWGEGGTAAERVPAHKLLGTDASRNRQKQRLGLGFFFPLERRGCQVQIHVEGQCVWCTGPPARGIAPSPPKKEVAACPPPSAHPGKWRARTLESHQSLPSKPQKSQYASCWVHFKPQNTFQGGPPPTSSLINVRQHLPTRRCDQKWHSLSPMPACKCGIRAGGPGSGAHSTCQPR